MISIISYQYYSLHISSYVCTYQIKFSNTRTWKLSKDQVRSQVLQHEFNICIQQVIILLNLSFDYFLFFNFNFYYSFIFSYYRQLDVQCTLRTNIILCLKEILGTSILQNIRQQWCGRRYSDHFLYIVNNNNIKMKKTISFSKIYHFLFFSFFVYFFIIITQIKTDKF